MRKLFFSILVSLSFQLTAQEYSIKLDPENVKFKEVEYSIWIPAQVKTIKGIIFHQHGCGETAFRSGRNAYRDLQWRALAKKWDFAYMSSSITSTKDCHDWVEPEEGSYLTFTRGISALAKLSNHAELEQAPWIIWGHSGGGHWAYKMVLQHPDRIIGAVLKSPAWTDTCSLGLKVPTLCLLGVQESYDVYSSFVWNPAITAMKYRISKGAPVCIAPDPTSGHESAKSRLLAISFIDELLKLRLNEATIGIDTSKQCFIDLDNFKVTNALKESSFRHQGNWFPTKPFAEKWSEFVRTGIVTDETAPAEAPNTLEALRKGTQNLLKWRTTADVEGGIIGFKVYRDQKLINADSIQSNWNFRIDYHDNPLYLSDTFEYVDRHAKPNKNYSYQVSLINQFGIESPKSEAVRIKKR